MEGLIYNKYHEKAKRIYLKDVDKELINHVELVAEISEYFCLQLGLNENICRTIMLGAYLHDIGRTFPAKLSVFHAVPHNKLGAKYMKYFLENDAKDYKDILKNIIKYHRGKMPPKKMYKDLKTIVAISIVRTADKIAANFLDKEDLKKKIDNIRGN